MKILAETKTNVLHCPSSNLKLGSGIAPVAEMLERGINVSLGADGAAWNNRLDMFTEMRSAALLQNVVRGTQTLPAERVLRMATIDGAHAVEFNHEIGSLEAGKRADISIVDLNRLNLTPRPNIVSAIIYAAEASDVRTVIIDGRIVMRDSELLTINEAEVIREANTQGEYLLKQINA